MYPYKKIKLPDGTTRDEHRLMVEAKLGRKLTFNEIVHHRDGDGRHNVYSNFRLITRSKHTKHHLKKGDVKLGIRCPSEEEKQRLRLLHASVDEKTARRIKYGNEIPKKLCAELKISKHVISKIRNGRTWGYL